MKVDLDLVETVRKKGGNLLVMLVVVFAGVGKKEDGWVWRRTGEGKKEDRGNRFRVYFRGVIKSNPKHKLKRNKIPHN